MKTVDLNKVLEMLINEEHEEATGLLHNFFVECSKQIHEELMSEDDTLSQDIEDDQEAIKAEEFYSEAEGDDAEAEAGEELDGTVEDEAGEEAGEEAEEAEEVSLGDTIEDLEAVMARLKQEYETIIGLEEPEHGVDIDGDDMIGDAPVDAEMDDEAVDSVETEESMTFESEEAGEEAEEVSEAEEFADLEESWSLEPVKDPNLNGGKEVGADGAKVAVNAKSPLPSHKASDRVGGKAVEVKAETHEGFELEAAPEVKAKPLLKNQVKKATDGRSKVSKEGDKSAMLNKKDGFGTDSPKSPIGGGAADLRGSDFKRK